MRDAIAELKKYKAELNDKSVEFVRRLAEVGIPVIDENTAGTGCSTRIEVANNGSTSTARLIVEGKELLFIEFGAGVYYNGSVGGSPHPKGQELGYTIGSYGKGKGKQETWAYYDDSNELVLTHGTKAAMPVYKAGLEIRRQIIGIAKEVFGG